MARIEMSTVMQGIRRVDQAARVQGSLTARFRSHQAPSSHRGLSPGPTLSLRARTQAHTVATEFTPPQPAVSEPAAPALFSFGDSIQGILSLAATESISTTTASEPDGDDPAALGAQHAQELEAAVEAGDDTEVARILAEIEAHGDDPAYAEAFTRELGPDGARQLFGRLAWDNPEGVTILADTIATGLDGYSLDELESYFIDLENDPNGGNHPYDALILNSPNADGRTFAVGINDVAGDGPATEPFTQFFGDEHPAAVVAANLSQQQIDEIAEFLASLPADQRQYYIESLGGAWDTDIQGGDAVAYQDYADAFAQPEVLLGILSSLRAAGETEALDQFLDFLALPSTSNGYTENEGGRQAVLRRFLTENPDYMAALVDASIGDPEASRRAYRLIEGASQWATPEELEALIGETVGSIARRDPQEAGELVGKFLYLLDVAKSAENASSTWDLVPVVKVAGRALIKELPGGDTLSEVVKYLEALWAGKPDTPANPEDAVAAQAEREGENNDLAWSLALTVVGLADPERAAEIVAVVESEYGGDYRAFLDDASNPDSPYHDVYELHDRYEDDIRDKRNGE